MKTLTAEGMYKDHYNYVIGFIMRKTNGDLAKSQDIVQETFIKVISKIEEFKGECHPRTWLCQIALSRLYNHHQSTIRMKRMPSGGFFDNSIFENENSLISLEDSYSHNVSPPLTMLIEKEDIKRVRVALGTLSDEDLKLFTMAVEEDISRAEIAKEFGIPVGTVRSRLNTIRGKIKKYVYRD